MSEHRISLEWDEEAVLLILALTIVDTVSKLTN